MNIRTYLITLIVTILMLSMASVAEEETKVTIHSRSLETDKNSNTELVLINITTNKLGRLIYIEEYFSKNESGNLTLDGGRLYFNDTIIQNVLILQIRRPLTKSGEQHKFIKPAIFIDGKRELYTWFQFKENEKGDNQKDNQKSPGFDIAIPTASIFIIYILKRKLTK